ncbi:hypothetical protein ADIARSV_4040 [Arcticibacter svalbardensis MN12-7]|uniref:Uncharacterized protein n=1 Tax=Arcticibacter svalbardensis MN12-7 TaxID=1150600 RepID=R9GM13_9SPHI|nr:hypothetical protein ADIARSV_4040 [Arcticibacter svalbardensis MN12-7]
MFVSKFILVLFQFLHMGLNLIRSSHRVKLLDIKKSFFYSTGKLKSKTSRIFFFNHPI